MKKLKRAVLAQMILSIFLFFSLSCGYAQEDQRDSENPYGVLGFLPWQHPWNSYHYDTIEKVEKAVKLMSEAGVGFVRLDFLWYDLEPEPGVFDFEWYDQVVDVLWANDIKILALLHYNPRWRQDVPWNAPPDFDLYKRYATAMVEHFKDRVKYWEIWNEPDEKTYWQPQDDMQTYTALLKMIYPEIKKVDPSAQVLMGGVSKTITVSLKRIYRNGGKDFFDVVNIHPFVDPLAPDAIDYVKGIYNGVCKEMAKYGDQDKKIWFTEIGCPGVKESTRENGWWNGISPTEEQQAQWVDTVFSECLKWPGVDKVFWAFFRDTDEHFKSGVDYFGLIRNDFTAKPAYTAYKRIAAEAQKEE
ncbi:MAG: beta-galactosidase [Candidatus Omnitrophica bacterium]|nr:beta-galactosidase [Candidatus Omnitrophota bacterium]